MPLLHQPVRIRWWIFAFLFAFATLAYLQRTSLGVVGPKMLPDLHLSHQQFGWLTTAFALPYAFTQIAAAAIGQRFGARATYIAVGLVGLSGMVLYPASPYLASGIWIFALLLVSQLVIGFSQAPVFPMFAAVVQQWFPEKRWALANGMQSAGMDLGGLLTAPLLVPLMVVFGWKGALLWLALPAAILTTWWAWYGRNTPEEHPKVTAEEIAELAGTDRTPAPPLTLARLGTILTNRDVLLLSLSYFGLNVAFYLLSTWSFMYLVEVQHLEGLDSGLKGAIPWLGAAVGAAIGGVVSDRLVGTLGARWGDRLVPLVTLPLAGVVLLVTTQMSTPLGAIASLAVAFCLIECNEGAYWAATMRVARADSGAATGVLNTGGNIAGIVTGPVFGYLSGTGSWNTAFVIGTLLCFIAAGIWLLINTERRVVAT